MVSLHTHVCVHMLTYLLRYRKEEKRRDGRGGDERRGRGEEGRRGKVRQRQR